MSALREFYNCTTHSIFISLHSLSVGVILYYSGICTQSGIDEMRDEDLPVCANEITNPLAMVLLNPNMQSAGFLW